MDPAEMMNKLPMAEVFKLKQLGENLEVDRVVGKRVLVRLVKPRTSYDEIFERTGIVAPNQETAEKYRPLSNMGIVIQVGEEVDGVYPGNMVFFSRYAGVEFTENRNEGSLKILWSDEILCTMKAREGALEKAISVLREEEVAA